MWSLPQVCPGRFFLYIFVRTQVIFSIDTATILINTYETF